MQLGLMFLNKLQPASFDFYVHKKFPSFLNRAKFFSYYKPLAVEILYCKVISYTCLAFRNMTDTGMDFTRTYDEETAEGKPWDLYREIWNISCGFSKAIDNYVSLDMWSTIFSSEKHTPFINAIIKSPDITTTIKVHSNNPDILILFSCTIYLFLF